MAESLLAQAERHFGTADLYAVLAVSKDADDAALKRAYYKLALRYHPDKAAGSATAAPKFQCICAVYQLLTDPRRRRVYDRTGEVDDVLPDGCTSDDDWSVLVWLFSPTNLYGVFFCQVRLLAGAVRGD